MIIYIKDLENEKLSFWEKIKVKLKMLLIRQIDNNRKIMLLPKIEDEKKFLKINKKLTKYPNSKVVLSKKLKKYESKICNTIIKGKIVQKVMIHKILKLVATNFKTQEIYILSKKYDLYVVNLSQQYIEKVKTVNIVTNDILKYKKLEEQIYNDKGIIITVTNNKKKSLKKARLIINIDFKNEEINKYNICRNSIIINISDDKINQITGFEGVIVNNVQIELDEQLRKNFIDDGLYGFFENSELYESIAGEKVENNRIRLKEIVGNNGIISFNEIQENNNKL